MRGLMLIPVFCWGVYHYNPLLGLGVLSVASIFLYRLHHIQEYVSKKYRLLKTVKYLLDHMSDTDDTASEFKIAESGNCAIITFSALGRTYTATVPYDRGKVVRMTSTEVRGCYSDGRPPVILHQYPGIPFLVSAEDMGFDYLEFFDFEEGEVTVTAKDAIPFYGQPHA